MEVSICRYLYVLSILKCSLAHPHLIFSENYLHLCVSVRAIWVCKWLSNSLELEFQMFVASLGIECRSIARAGNIHLTTEQSQDTHLVSKEIFRWCHFNLPLPLRTMWRLLRLWLSWESGLCNFSDTTSSVIGSWGVSDWIGMRDLHLDEGNEVCDPFRWATWCLHRWIKRTM